MLDDFPWWRCRIEAMALAKIAEEATGFPHMDILGPSRKGHLIEPRKWVIRELRGKGYSTPQIGRAMDRDHTTIMHHLGMTKASRDVKRWKDGA